MIEAINTAVANDPAVQACRARARAAGVELNLSLEAVPVSRRPPKCVAADGDDRGGPEIPPVPSDCRGRNYRASCLIVSRPA